MLSLAHRPNNEFDLIEEPLSRQTLVLSEGQRKGDEVEDFAGWNCQGSP